MKTSHLILFVFGFCFIKTEAADVESLFDNLMSKHTAHSTPSYSSLFDKLRELMKQGYPDAGIPILDPYQLDDLNIDFENNIFRILAKITDNTFVGLSDFEMRKFMFSMEKEQTAYIVYFDVYFPSLNFTSEYYKMEGSIIEAFPLAGEGLAHAEVYGLNIWGKLYFKLKEDGSGALIDRLEDPRFHVSRILSKVQYDNNIDDIANAMVEDLLAVYLNRFSKYLAVTYSPHIVQALNAVLSEKPY